MSYLSKIKSNKLKQFIMLLQGDPGCGKSTMANQIPDTLYLGIESIGLVRDNLIDKNDIPNYNALLEILTEIRDDPEFAFKSIVLDSATAINRLMENYILDKYTINGNRPTSIIDENNRDLNFGKGEKILDRMWNDFMDLLIEIREIHNVRITLIAHQVKTQITNSMEEQTITKEVADVNKRCLNKILASCDLVCALEKVYKLKNYGAAFRGNQKKMVKEETVVIRMNSQYVLGKVRDIYLNKELIKDNIITLKNEAGEDEEFDLGEYPLPNKDTMYADFEKLINPTLRLTGNSTFTKNSPEEVSKMKEKTVATEPKRKRRIADELDEEEGSVADINN